MKKGLIFSLFVLGVSSVIAQVIVLREMTVSFYGNEFFMGVVLASWLFWVAVGSGVLGKILNRLKKILTVLISLHFLVGAFFFLGIFLIRLLKTWVGFPGEIPNLVTAGLSAFLIPAPLCLILGLWWTTATRIFSQDHSPTERVNVAYFIETLGFILGGIAFSFYLVYLQEFATAAVLMLFNLAAVIFLLSGKKGYVALKAATLFLFFLFILLSYSPPLMEKLNEISQSFRFKSQTLIESDNSRQGNIAVTKTDSQYNFYESGLLVGSTENIEFAEQLVHLSLLQHPSPKKVLLIGGGFMGALTEILKHPVEKVYYLELDPKLIEVSQKYISQEFKDALTDQKVEIVHTDGRYFLRKTEEKFDVILINLPDPSTALISRFYTKEFFEIAKEKLGPSGIFATYLTFSPSTAGKNLENLNVSIFKTLKKVFPYVIVLPEETNLFLASSNPHLTFYAYAQNVKLLEERKIETKFITPEYLAYRLSNDRLEKTLALFEKNQEAKINRDFKPVAYFYQTLFWLDHFYPAFSNFFKNLASAFWLIFVGGLIFLTLTLRRTLRSSTPLEVSRSKRKHKAHKPLTGSTSKGLKLPLLSVAVAGFSLMALETLIIFSYQTAVGFLYHRIALLIAALMVGMALGVWYGNLPKFQRNLGGQKAKLGQARYLCKFHLFLIVFCTVLPLVLGLAKEIVFLVCAVIAGFLGAAIFPLANHIYLSQQPNPHKKTGTIYAADLLGSCFGALLPGLILIPVFGVVQSLIFIALVNLWIVLNLIFLCNR